MCCSALVVALSFQFAFADSANITVKDILTRNVAARGGLEKIKSVRAIILRGPVRENGKPGRFMVKARPCYFLVGEPLPGRTFAEGFDGSAWEYYADPGLVLRTSGAPAAASRHTSYFDDPLVSSLDSGWIVDLVGSDTIANRPAFWLRATFPDGFQSDLFVDKETWLVIANRKTAQIHAFGDEVATETRISDYRDLNGALYPMRFEEFVIATGKPVSDSRGGWATWEINPNLPIDYFSPPLEPKLPLSRMLNAIYATRDYPVEALKYYRDFRSNPETKSVNTESGLEAVAYQCLKAGSVSTAIVLLEENLRDYPNSANAHFGLGRAYRAAGNESSAVDQFRLALKIDPEHKRSVEALKSEGSKK